MKQTYSPLPSGSLDETHKWRLTQFRHIYYCHACIRNLESREDIDDCKFCGDKLIEIIPTHPIEAYIKIRSLMYKCKNCMKYLIGNKETVKCIECGTEDIEFYDKFREFQKKSQNYRKKLKERQSRYKKSRKVKTKKSGFLGFEFKK